MKGKEELLSNKFYIMTTSSHEVNFHCNSDKTSNKPLQQPLLWGVGSSIRRSHKEMQRCPEVGGFESNAGIVYQGLRAKHGHVRHVPKSVAFTDCEQRLSKLVWIESRCGLGYWTGFQGCWLPSWNWLLSLKIPWASRHFGASCSLLICAAQFLDSREITPLLKWEV